MGFYPPLWGPYFWTALHLTSLGYPSEPSEQEKSDAEAFVRALRSVLPCPQCRVNYVTELEKLPPTLDSKAEFIEWGRLIHNAVNRRLGKREWEREEFFAHYAKMMYDPEKIKQVLNVQREVLREPERLQQLSEQAERLTREKDEAVDRAAHLHLSYRERETKHRNTETVLVISLVVALLAIIGLGAVLALKSNGGNRSRKQRH